MKIVFVLRDKTGKFYTGDGPDNNWSKDIKEANIYENYVAIEREFLFAKENTQLIGSEQPIEVVTILK